MAHLAAATPVTFIITRDKRVSATFYSETLELPLGKQDDFATVYDLAGTILRVTEVPGFEASVHPVLGWSVADMTATCTKLRDKGVSFTIYPGFGQDDLGIWTAPDGSTKVAWFNDPDGNVLSLTQG